MTQTYYTSRSAVISYQRCRRMRWLEYFAGERGMGLSPKQRSIHLVLGGAVHAGLEVLLREGQQAVDSLAGQLHDEGQPEVAVEQVVAALFGSPVVRKIEDEAVAAALTDLAVEMTEGGVEVDAEEAAQKAKLVGQPEVVNDLVMPGMPGQESPIVVEFAGMGLPSNVLTAADLRAEGMMQVNEVVLAGRAAFLPQSDADYLREEIAALTEAMVRAYARRRWRPLLEQFEVLEVEREGEWKLGDIPHTRMEWRCGHCGCTSEQHGIEGYHCVYEPQLIPIDDDPSELHFLSRHDALLLERSTGYLYLQSYKTTGSWDRRKELDAQVDMQGLSEAVDVERRMGEAWELLQEQKADADGPIERLEARGSRIAELVGPSAARWLRTLPDPPTILGVRYEYLLKGSRKENKKAQPGEPRWNQESILVRAYKQEGITSDDRRWAWTYDWQDESGKSRRLDYRSWQKAPVWKWHPGGVAGWIDDLDQGKVQEGALNEQGEPLDALAEQFVPPLTQYRNRDETLDWLEQTEAQEIQVAKDVEAVREAEKEGGYAAKRSELNRRFPQNRQACSYPGVCQYRSTPTKPGFCFGPPDAEHDPSVLEHYRERVPNHPRESELVQVEVK